MSNENQSFENINHMISKVKEAYEFKRLFNGMLRVKPLMIACTADANPDIIK